LSQISHQIRISFGDDNSYIGVVLYCISGSKKKVQASTGSRPTATRWSGQHVGWQSACQQFPLLFLFHVKPSRRAVPVPARPLAWGGAGRRSAPVPMRARARFVQCRKQQPPLPRPLTAHAFRAGDDTHTAGRRALTAAARAPTSLLDRLLACLPEQWIMPPLGVRTEKPAALCR
jgi:hypothetical protein